MKVFFLKIIYTKILEKNIHKIIKKKIKKPPKIPK